MSMIQSDLLLGQEGGAGYVVERSLRFNSSDSAFCARTPSSAGNRKTFTFAAWIKRSALGGEDKIFTAGSGGNITYLSFGDNVTDGLTFARYTGTHTFRLSTTQVFRDPSAWYHVILAVDTTQATDANRVKIYVNGTQVTAFTTASYPAQNLDLEINNTNDHRIGDGTGSYSGAGQFDGYLADVIFIDGQQLTPSSLVEVSATTGQLIPKAYTGTFTGNSFWLKFADNSAATATTLGKDSSGLGNNWTPNNFGISDGINSVATATGALPIYNTTDTYGTVKGSGTRTDSSASSLVLALAMDGANNGTTFTDLSATIKGSGSAKSITVNGAAKTVTSDSKFYGSSGYFDGSSSLTIPDSADWAFGSGDFCIEFWAKTSSGLLSFGQGEGGSPAFSVPYAGMYIGPSIWSFDFGVGTAIPVNRWFHYAVVRSGNTINFYIDGIRYGSHSYSSSWPDSPSDFTIGTTRGIGFPVYFQDFRVYKGTAKYTSNFNPPSSTQNPTIAAGNDSLVDTPTSGSQVDTGLGGQVTGNYATLNPLATPAYTYSNGNLDVSGNTPNTYAPSTIALPLSGKYYFEYTCTNTAGSNRRDTMGVVDLSKAKSYLSNIANTVVYFSLTGDVYSNSSSLAVYSSYTNGDIVQCAIDCDTGKVWFGKNGTFNGSPSASTGQVTTLTNNGSLAFAVGSQDNSGSPYSLAGSVNFGARSFAYTAPSGFKALCDTNLPAPVVAKPSDYFQTVLYTGNGSTQTISGLGFSPDLVWIKQRSSTQGHALVDSVRGNDKRLFSELTSAEDSVATLTSFNSDGFSVAVASLSERTNANTATYAAWAWDAGTTTVTNTQGSITSQVRANPSAGFSIVTYTGTGSAATVGHGLGVAPAFIITKSRNNAYNWTVYHSSLGINQYLWLDSTAAASSSSGYWNTAPTSTVFGVGNNNTGSSGSNIVAYCFSPVAGYSSFGSYTGNGSSDGPFVYTGFRPRFLLIKVTTTTNVWLMIDAARDGYNVAIRNLNANSSDAELAVVTWVDLLSNGFKIRNGTDNAINTSNTYIYAAFAENPFQYARAR